MSGPLGGPALTIGNTLPSGSVFDFGGQATVTMTYTPGPSAGGGGFSALYDNPSPFSNGSLSQGGDTYTWGNQESLQRTHLTPGNVAAEPWSVTYEFDIEAEHLVLGIWGLGRTDKDHPGFITTATVALGNKYTYLGEYGQSSFYGPNEFTDHAGALAGFMLQNSRPGDSSPGNPSFNTCLAIVRIEGALDELTVSFSQIGSDGTGVSIGYFHAVPEPSTWAMLGLGLASLAARTIHRRRRTDA